MAWITINSQDIVTRATPDMTQLLGHDPQDQPLSSIWTPVDGQESLVSTQNESRTLCICSHTNNDYSKTIICTDLTDLDQLYNQSRSNHNNHDGVAISRLTVYGTIEAVFQSHTNTHQLVIGQPMMRYIHSDDVQQFCAGLSEATKYSTITHFSVRLVNDSKEQWTEFTVMATGSTGGKILCLMKPIVKEELVVMQTSYCSSMLRDTVTQVQNKIWYALEHGMTLVARHLATSLILMIQTVWCLWQENKANTSWSGLFATSSQYVLRKVVQCTKERPEIDKVCRIVSWVGISQTVSRSWFDHTLDQTSEWLLAKTFSNDMYDNLV
jgi:hypothetical protein